MRIFVSLPIRTFIAVVVVFFIAGCSSTAAAIEVTESTVVIDVRSAEEFGAGHLAGAELLDFNAGDLEASLTQLDPEADYLVYCRSGNRSAQAVAMMEDAGFTKVTDLGSMESAAKATGISIVKD